MNTNTAAATTTTHLQGLGLVDAIAYGNVKAGDRIVFNYGSIYRAESTSRVGTSTVEVTATDERTGKTYTFRRRASSLIGYIAPKS